MSDIGQTVYKKMKSRVGRKTFYKEEIHCAQIIDVMNKYGHYSKFCIDNNIAERTIYDWMNDHDLFKQCYELGKMYARFNWEQEGKDLLAADTLDYAKLEYWRLMGWSRFGVGKNPRIRLNLTPGATPDKHYQELLKQAGDGEFTSAEIKQLMEAINVGINAHQLYDLQAQIDEMKKDLEKVDLAKNGENTYSAKRVKEKDSNSVAD